MSSFQAAAAFPFISVNPSRMEAWTSLSLQTLLDACQKNLTALSRANQVAFEGLATLMQRQATLLNATVEDCSRGMNDFLVAASPEAKASRQADTARHAYESTAVHLREFYEIATRTQTAAAEILNARLAEGLDEIRVLFAAPVERNPADAKPVAVIVEPVPASEQGSVTAEVVAETVVEAATPADAPAPVVEEAVEEDEAEMPSAPRRTRPRSPRSTGGSGYRADRRPTRD